MLGLHFLVELRSLKLANVSPLALTVTVVEKGYADWTFMATRVLEPGDQVNLRHLCWRFRQSSYGVSTKASGPLVPLLYRVASFEYGGELGLCVEGETVKSVSSCTTATEFAAVEFDDAGRQSGVFTLALGAPLPGDGNGEMMPFPQDLSQARNDARTLAQILPLRYDFLRRWEGRDFPYLAGIDFADSNSAFARGIDVSEALAKTPFGVDVPVSKGDIVFGFRIGEHIEPLFGEADFWRALLDFAEKHGVSNAFYLQFVRGDELYEAPSTFYFNAAAFPQDLNAPFETVACSSVDGLTLGFQAEVFCGAGSVVKQLGSWLSGAKSTGPSFERCVFHQTQRCWRLAQFNPTAAKFGLMLGGLQSLVRTGIRSLARSGARATFMQRIIKNSAIESVESAVTTYRQTPRGSALAEPMSYSIPMGAGLGAVIGIVKSK